MFRENIWFSGIFREALQDEGVFGAILRTPQTLLTAAIMLVAQITWMINGNFWSSIVTQKLHIPDQHLALFPFIRSLIMLTFFFAIAPRINKLHYKWPMAVGFLVTLVSQLLLVTAPDQSYVFLILSVFLDACSFAGVGPLIDKLIVLNIDAKERSRIQSILFMSVILLTSPFGWIAGTLSGIDRSLPFILNIVLFAVGAGLAYDTGTRFPNNLDSTSPEKAAA